jgi:hypothetical protein
MLLMATKEKRISLRFDAETWLFLKHLSVEQCRSMNEIVGELVRGLKDKHQKRLDYRMGHGKMTPERLINEGY